jgi:uncharacterized membrane protein
MLVRVTVPHVGALFSGWLVLSLLDCVWLTVTKLKCFSGYANLRKGVETSKGVFAVLLYTFIASVGVSMLRFESYAEATSFGAVAGFIVFASYNITTLTVDSRWLWPDALCDTAYGAVSWSVMLASSHSVICDLCRA